MKKSGIIISTVLVFLLFGGLIIGWSVYQGKEHEMPYSMVLEFTDENFKKEVVDASNTLPVLVDFYAEWCYPCKMMDPIIEQVAKELKGQAVIGKVDTDRNMISRQLGVDRIPAVFIIRNGEIKDAYYGVVPKEKMIESLKKFVSEGQDA